MSKSRARELKRVPFEIPLSIITTPYNIKNSLEHYHVAHVCQSCFPSYLTDHHRKSYKENGDNSCVSKVTANSAEIRANAFEMIERYAAVEGTGAKH